jgi:ribonuclease Z
MKPIFHSRLVNGVFGDPAVYVEFLFDRRALLFDLGDLHVLPSKKVLRVSDVFVSHTHMDHFNGFDQLLRICLGRDKILRLFGPPGFIDRAHHKLSAYTWNLVENYANDFTLEVTEVQPQSLRTVRFRCHKAFQAENPEIKENKEGVILDEDTFRIRATCLDHSIPCIAFALEEKAHINIMKNKLEAMGLPVGPWLKELKAAVVRGDTDKQSFRIWWKEAGQIRERFLLLGLLKSEILQITQGQKITYVVDSVYHEENAKKIVDLARGSDILFIECSFLQQDAQHAAQKYHLTARQAGLLGKAAGAKRLVPFHFSPRYGGREDFLIHELQEAFGYMERFKEERSKD